MSGRFECAVYLNGMEYLGGEKPTWTQKNLDDMESNGDIIWKRVSAAVGHYATQHAKHVFTAIDPRHKIGRCDEWPGYPEKYKFVEESTLNGAPVYVYKYANGGFGIVIREVEDMLLHLDFSKGDCKDEAILTKFAAKDIDEPQMQCVEVLEFPHDPKQTITIKTITQRVLDNGIMSGRLSDHSRIKLWGLGRNALSPHKVLKKAMKKITKQNAKTRVRRTSGVVGEKQSCGYGGCDPLDQITTQRVH